MKYAILGSGKIGAALARIFAKSKIEMGIANSRGPKTLTSLQEELGPGIVPYTLQEALTADVLFLAVPFSAHKDVGRQLSEWTGKIVVDVTNALHVAPEELGGLLSSESISRSFKGARLVKAFTIYPRNSSAPIHLCRGSVRWFSSQAMTPMPPQRLRR